MKVRIEYNLLELQAVRRVLSKIPSDVRIELKQVAGGGTEQ